MLHSLKKLTSKETSISAKYIFDAHSKSASFKEKISLHIFKKHDYASCTSKGFPSNEKVMILISLKLLSIYYLQIHLCASKYHIIPHLKLLWNSFLRNLIFFRNLLFNMLTPCMLFHQGSNRQEINSGTFLNRHSNLKWNHLLLDILQWSRMIQRLKFIIHLWIILLLSSEILQKNVHYLS